RVNEAETRAQLIDPALVASGWGADGSSIRREFPVTHGRLLGAGKRDNALSADYVLIYKNTKLAVIEAKPRDADDTAGVGQAKQYADMLEIRHAYSTNGRGIYQIDMDIGAEGRVG